MTDKPKKLDEDRKSQLEHRLYKRYETIYEEGEEAVISWIEEQQVTRAEAEQIADANGTFLHQRLSTLLDEEGVAIFVDDKLEDDKRQNEEVFDLSKSTKRV